MIEELTTASKQKFRQCFFLISRASYAVWEFEAMHGSHLGPGPNKARCVLPVHL